MKTNIVTTFKSWVKNRILPSASHRFNILISSLLPTMKSYLSLVNIFRFSQTWILTKWYFYVKRSAYDRWRLTILKSAVAL